MPDISNVVVGATTVGANYLKVLQSPGAALNGLNGNSDAPLLTFSTPNLRAFKVTVTGINLDTNSELANSNWSKAVRALQVTSELFAVFAPSNADPSIFVYMAPDFNTNAGPATNSNPLSTPLFTTVETAIADALGIAAGDVAVAYTALTGTTWS
jgi:hypothetical protein